MGLNIKKIRKEKKIKLIDLCKLTGLAKSTIWRLETGKSSPKMDTLIKIKDALGCEIDDLM